ncbi:hypothetical protein pb186bvf_008316 [Paramecium bursaria]
MFPECQKAELQHSAASDKNNFYWFRIFFINHFHFPPYIIIIEYNYFKINFRNYQMDKINNQEQIDLELTKKKEFYIIVF